MFNWRHEYHCSPNKCKLLTFKWTEVTWLLWRAQKSRQMWRKWWIWRKRQIKQNFAQTVDKIIWVKRDHLPTEKGPESWRIGQKQQITDIAFSSTWVTCFTTRKICTDFNGQSLILTNSRYCVHFWTCVNSHTRFSYVCVKSLIVTETKLYSYRQLMC